MRNFTHRSLLLPLALIVALTTLAAPAGAQTTTTETQAGTQSVFAQNVFGVGLSASLCTGMGLSFKQHFANTPLAYQVTGGVWKTSTLFMYDIGGELQYDLSLSSNRLYAVGGLGYYYYGNNSNELASPVRFGAGIGYETTYSKNIGTAINLMVTFFEPDGTILPLPSIGFFVYFK